MAKHKFSFTESEIQLLFGHEAAEDEDTDRLRKYYFKSDIYNQIAHADDLKLRILVGHKGIGKSALLKIDMAEKEENNLLVVLIKPNDISKITTRPGDFLQIIEDWKNGLTEIIAKKVLDYLGGKGTTIPENFAAYGGKLIDFLRDVFKEKINSSLVHTHKQIMKKFFEQGKYLYLY